MTYFYAKLACHSRYFELY